MSDYVARLAGIVTLEAPDWRARLQAMAGDARQFVSETQRTFEALKGPAPLPGRSASGLNFGSAVPAPNAVPAVSPSEQYAINNRLNRMYGRADADALQSSRDEYKFHQRFNSFVAGNKENEADAAMKEFVEATRASARAAKQGAKDEEAFWSRIRQARQQLTNESSMRWDEYRNRIMDDKRASLPVGGRSLWDVMGPSQTSDWRQSWMGKSSPVGFAQTSDWRQTHYGDFSPIDTSMRGMHSLMADNDTFWDSKSAKFKGHPERFNERLLRNANFAGQQVAYAIDDAIQSYQYGGASASIRAASNNLTAVAGTVLSPKVAVPAVIGISMATALASQMARNVGNDSPWAKLGQEQWSTDKADPLRGAGAGSYTAAGLFRTLDQGTSFLGGDTRGIKRDAMREMIRMENRSWDIDHKGFDMEWASRAQIRQARDFDAGQGVYRSQRDAYQNTADMQKANRIAMQAAYLSGDTQKGDKLAELDRQYERQLEVQRKMVAEAEKQLPIFQAQSDKLRQLDRDSSRRQRNLDYSVEFNRTTTWEDYAAGLTSNAAERRKQIKAMGLHPDREADMLRDLAQGLQDDLSKKDEFEHRQFRKYQAANRTLFGMERHTSFDNMLNSFNNFREDQGLSANPDNETDPRKRALARRFNEMTADRRADFLFEQRQMWRVKPPGWSQLDENMEIYGKRLKEIEETQGLTPEERKRQMKAAKTAFEDANKLANIPSGLRKFSSEGLNFNSREDVALEAFMVRGAGGAGKQNPMELVAAKVDETNRLLVLIEKKFSIKERTA